mmetsp:Transcript_32558/g.83003  ORF Transcript_32558/g.83003 Transcript_32558/m.83003 type:complete len:200 (+) Transcript_32558:203-802(+)
MHQRHLRRRWAKYSAEKSALVPRRRRKRGTQRPPAWSTRSRRCRQGRRWRQPPLRSRQPPPRWLHVGLRSSPSSTVRRTRATPRCRSSVTSSTPSTRTGPAVSAWRSSLARCSRCSCRSSVASSSRSWERRTRTATSTSTSASSCASSSACGRATAQSRAWATRSARSRPPCCRSRRRTRCTPSPKRSAWPSPTSSTPS